MSRNRKESKLSRLFKESVTRIKKAQEEGFKEIEPKILCSGRIPKPLHGLAPRVILGQSWWNKTRKAAYASTNYHCLACGVHKSKAQSRQWLEGHELYDIDFVAGVSVYLRTVPLCHYCHNYIHEGRLEYLLERGKIHHAKYVAIIQHGDALLKRHKLKRIRYEGPMADWDDWVLIIDGVEYPSLYRSEEHYNKVMDSQNILAED